MKLGLKRFDGNKTRASNWIGITVRTFRNWEIEFDIRKKRAPITEKGTYADYYTARPPANWGTE